MPVNKLIMLYIGSSASAVLSTLEPITGIVSGIAVFGEHLTAIMAAGCVLVIVSVVIFCTPPGAPKQ